MYLDMLRSKGKSVYKKDGYTDVERLSTLLRVWQGPKLEVPADMTVVPEGTYDHLLVDVLNPRTLASFPPCGSHFDLHSLES
jgi:hypothetical protein